MQKIKFYVLAICGLLMLLLPFSVQAANKINVQVELPNEEVVTMEMLTTDYVGNIKYKLQPQVDIDLNKMDLMYQGKVLSEVVRFSSARLPEGAVITIQPSTRWKYDEVKGVDDITFSIARPKEENLTKVYAKDYGMSPSNADNTEAFTKAIKACSANKHLVIEQGVYHFRNMTKDLEFNNMENVIIDGNGSTFIFDNKHCIQIYGGNGVEFRNLKVNWDWEKIPVGSLVQIENRQSRNVFDIKFIGVDEVDENIPIGTFMYLDPDNLSVGSYGTYKAYTPGSVPGCLQNVEKVDHNVLRITHNGDMRHFNEGDYFLLRHFEYSGRVFSTTSYAKNITFDNVRIYGFTGMGWVFSYKANHFQIINSYLGLDPDGPKERRISTAADAIHILNTGGYFRISNNDLSFTGDDIINIHDDAMDVLNIDSSRTVMRGWSTSGFLNEGDIVEFRNSNLGKFTDYEAKVVSATTDPNAANERIITFAEPLPAEITSDCIACSKSQSSTNYVISNNYIHEARARAALLNADNGLFENNYVYRILSGAVQVCAEVRPGKYLEGVGANHVVIRNNTFEESNFGSGEPLIYIRVKIGESPGTERIISDVRIEDNVFLNCIYKEERRAVWADNVDGITISGNVLEEGGDIILNDGVGARTVTDNNFHTEHTYTNGVCSICNKVWEKEIDGITYRVVTETVKRRPIAVIVPNTAGEVFSISVVKAEGVEDKDVVLAGDITDEATGQKYVLTRIEKDVFAGINVASITIPKTVTELGENALGEIENVVYLGKNPPKEDPESTDGQDKPGQTGSSDRNETTTADKNLSTTESNTSNTSSPSSTLTKKKQTITVSKKVKKTVSIKSKTLKKKSVSIKLKAKASGKGKLTYKVTKYPKGMKKYIKVSKKGVITLKKKAKKGTYKIKITAAAKGKYKKATKTVTIKVK